MAPTDDIKSKLEAEYGAGKILHVKRLDEEAIFRRPNRHEWRRFLGELGDDDTKAMATERLVVLCCVYPAPEELDKILNDKPALAQSWGNELTSFAGLGRAEVLGK